MQTDSPPHIQLVITAALKKEIPAEWFEAHGVPVLTFNALKSGGLSHPGMSDRGMLVVLTGVGLKASEEAACWIRDNIKPLFVLNIGTCGVLYRRLSLHQWIRPERVSNEKSVVLTIEQRLPVPALAELTPVHSLVSVVEPVLDSRSGAWSKHAIVDMESFAQAKLFSASGISYHCLKFSTDYADADTCTDFEKSLTPVRQGTKTLFRFIEYDMGENDISVVIPVYNRQKTIERAVDSVLKQSCQPHEILIVDDCSTDRTPDILAKYGDKLTVIRLEKNSGPSKARNEGTKNTRTEWIAFMDSDDCWEKDKLKGQIEYLKRYPFYQIIKSEEKWIRNGKRVNPCRHHKKPIGWIWEPSLERCLVSPSGVLIKKSLLQQYGYFDESLPVCEDYDLWLRISRHHPVGLDPLLSVVKYGGHEDQLSRKYPAMDMFRVTSLVKALKNETDPDSRRKIIEILSVKLNILIKGHEKRGNEKDARDYRNLRESLAEYL